MLWSLSGWVAPGRLRMEFLNNSRNDERYSGDPLAPSCYRPDALFATVMFSNPLGWFETSHLPPSYFDSVAPLVKIWKDIREPLFGGVIVPIGNQPDGMAWTGFLSLGGNRGEGYALFFRELNPNAQSVFEFPGLFGGGCHWERLAGAGAVEAQPGGVKVRIPEPLGFLLAHFRVSY